PVGVARRWVSRWPALNVLAQSTMIFKRTRRLKKIGQIGDLSIRIFRRFLVRSFVALTWSLQVFHVRHFLSQANNSVRAMNVICFLRQCASSKKQTLLQSCSRTFLALPRRSSQITAVICSES